EALERAVRLGIELRVPVVGAVATSGADVGEGMESLHAAGRVARALSDASGVVPTLLAVVGPCVSGPALVLGLVDQVVMTSDAFAYVSGPDTASEFTGVPVSPVDLGGAAVHDLRSGVAAVVVDDDVDASRKGARFVQWCDAFNVPLVTFVDTPGFEPGTDLEWRGMIRHGAQLVHAYAAATVPRLCVALRKAYGGAYIVMDSKTLGN